MAPGPAMPRTAARGLLAGAAIGVIGGLAGFGGAEFRLPVLIGVFAFAALAAVIVNKVLSLVVVAVAIPVRLVSVPLGDVSDAAWIVLNLLAGSLIGAWIGASWATRMRSATLYRVLAVLLVAIAAVFLMHHSGWITSPGWTGPLLVVAGVLAGFAIGVVAAVMGVAGGELLVPTITVLYGVGVAAAGTLSLLVALPTMVVALLRYRQDQAFVVLREEPGFVAAMAVGSVLGAITGGLLAGVVPATVLGPVIVILLLISAWRVWRHAGEEQGADPGGETPRVSR